jgi:GntR family transcriptional regulator
MELRISRASGVPLRLQVGRQIAVLIATGELKPGEYLPSVRALAKRLKIHHNTISQAYQDLVGYCLVERHRGSRMIVPFAGVRTRRDKQIDLDEIISSAIQLAQAQGYRPHQFCQRTQERFLTQRPDHLLVVIDDPGLRELIRVELADQVKCKVAVSSIDDLSTNPVVMTSALVVGLHGGTQKCSQFLPKDRPPYSITLNTAAREVALVRNLQEPSAIAVVSVSELFLQTARALFAPALGDRHTLREFFVPREKPKTLASFDLVFCDSITRQQVTAKKVVHYRLVSAEAVEYLRNVIAPH